MKRIVRILVALSLAVVMGMAFVGCGGGDVAGTYKFESMDYSGMTFTADSLDELSETTGQDFNIDDFNLVLTEDGKFNLSVMGNSQEGTYKVSGDKLTLTASGSDVVADIKGGEVTMEAGGVKVVFKK